MTAATRAWQRFTPGQRLARFAVELGLVAAVVVSLRSIEVIPEFISDAPEQMRDLFVRMWPPDWAYYPGGVHEALVETLHIATQGTLLAIVMAVPLGLLVARNVTRSPTLNFLARLLLVSSRSINSLVWALLFVGIFGPGPLAGTLATAFRSVGFVGKLLGEALEETPRGMIEALEATGARRGAILRTGYWPHLQPSFWSIALFRWDINVRESSVLGLVGAGGVGRALVETLHIATQGTLLAILMAVPLGLLVARNVTPSATLNVAARLLLVSSRSINSLVWALLFVGIFGPGPLAGTLATAFRSVGFVGKLLGEALEETPRGMIEALEATGARRGAILRFGYWPHLQPSFWSIALFRWDINVRESSVLGLVGAGGVGMALDSAMNLFQWQRVAMILLAIFAVVVLAEMAVTAIRKRVL